MNYGYQRTVKTPFEDVFAVGDVTSLVVAENKAVPKAVENTIKAVVSALIDPMYLTP